MTVTFNKLVGARENLDLVILANVIDQWDDTKTDGITPTLECMTLNPEKTVETLHQVGPERILFHLPIRTRELEEEDEPLGDYSHVWHSNVGVEIWASNNILLGLFEDELNRIFWELAPQSGDTGSPRRLFKSDGANPPVGVSAQSSEVNIFVGSEIEFEFVTDDDDYPDLVGSTGELVCQFVKFKT